MAYFTQALKSWGSEAYEQSLKADIRQNRSLLPPEQALVNGGMLDDSDIGAPILSIAGDADTIEVKTIIFFTEIMICCGCGDDPESQPASCEVILQIDVNTTFTRARLVDS